MSDRTTRLTGWGRTAPSVARLVEAQADEVPDLLRRADRRGVIARGLGRSYGDAAQNAGGTVIAPLAGDIAVDPAAGVARVSAGASLHDVIRAALPLGWFVPVTPGTRYVSIGGAIACDVHGKNHHQDGSLGAHLVDLDLVLPDGSRRTVGPSVEPDLFNATVGGMGLTGVITSATLSLIPVTTGWMKVTTERLADIDAVMSRMLETDATHRYTVCWIDTLARGRSLGRSVLTLGEHARPGDLDRNASKDPRRLPSPSLLNVPKWVPSGLMTTPNIRAFNELYFRKAPRRRVDEIQSISTFFHPLDGVNHWNRLYGRRGFVQYQFVIPDQSAYLLPGILERIQGAGHPSFLSVIKRFGGEGNGLLSFPMRGWTLAMDLPVAVGVDDLFADLDLKVLEAGGRLYLAKDSRLGADMAQAMYPRWQEFRRLRERLDPRGVLQSDLSRRLDL